MKPIANSQLTGKWYCIARTYNCFEMNFCDIFLYVLIGCKNYMDLLYVGIKEDRSKILKKLTLKAFSGLKEKRKQEQKHLIMMML